MTQQHPRYDLPRKNAQDISVDGFRLLFQWPLLIDTNRSDTTNGKSSRAQIADGLKLTREALRVAKWEQVVDPAMGKGAVAIEARDSYEERIYFHDFVPSFLFPKAKASDSTDTNDTTWRCNTYSRLRAEIDGFVIDFSIERMTLNLFEIGVAVASFEIDFTSVSVNGERCKLTLDKVQTTIDQLRRGHVPYWDIKDGTPKRVPRSVTLFTAGDGAEYKTLALDWPDSFSPIDSSDSNIPETDPRATFGHWRALISPLLLSRMQHDAAPGVLWRDPNDERIPVNALILLTPESHLECSDVNADQQAILAIKDSDWLRLADAEEAGPAFPYNADFASKTIGNISFYDRFLPSPEAGSWFATRHIIYGPFYGIMHSGNYFASTITKHFRRHYADLTLVVRLELSALLALSRQLTELIRKTTDPKDQDQREEGITDLQDQFLDFSHRYRFTGASSQVQPTELLHMLRRALGLDQLFAEVRDEIESAATAVRSHQSRREGEAAARLNRIAFVGLLLGVIAGLLGGNYLGGVGEFLATTEGWSSVVKIVGIGMMAMGLAGFLAQFVQSTKTALTWTLGLVTISGAVLMAAGIYMSIPPTTPAPPIPAGQPVPIFPPSADLP